MGALVYVLATKAYQNTRKRSLLLIAIAAALGGVITVVPELGTVASCWGYWYLEMAMRVAGDVLWLVGCWLLFQHYTDLIRRSAQDAPPNGGPATPVASPGVTGRPPSAS